MIYFPLALESRHRNSIKSLSQHFTGFALINGKEKLMCKKTVTILLWVWDYLTGFAMMKGQERPSSVKTLTIVLWVWDVRVASWMRYVSNVCVRACWKKV